MVTTQHKSVRVVLEKLDGHFELVKSLPDGPRGSQTNTLLYDGKVLIAGGDNGKTITGIDALGKSTLDTAYVYNPYDDSYSPTGNLMMCPREKHTATALTSDGLEGHILIVGGAAYNGVTHEMDTGDQATAELYDPDPLSRKFSNTAQMKQSNGRVCHAAVMLTSGKVLIMGGFAGEDQGHPHASAELFDPLTELFELVPDGMVVGRHCFHAIVLESELESGNVFIAGGRDGYDATDDCRIYDESENKFQSAGTLMEPRSDPAMIQLKDGTILIAGGWNTDSNGNVSTSNTAEIYNPETRAHYYTYDRIGEGNPRTFMQEVRCDIFFGELPNGKILIAGGVDFDDKKNPMCVTAELYDPVTGCFTPTDSPNVRRRAENNAMVKLKNGDLLLVGGWNGENRSQSVQQTEVYSLDISTTKQVNSYAEGPVVRQPL